MAIISRDLARSEKRREQPIRYDALATGVTALLDIVPYNAILDGVNVAAFGVSGSPVWSLSVFRFNSSGGLTSMGLGVTLSVLGIGTSGCLGMSLPAGGYTLLAGDVLTLTTGGSNAAVATSAVTVLLRSSADIRVFQNAVS